MTRTTLALALTGLILGGGTTVLFAGDPPVHNAPSAEIAQRVEDLGSSDFRVREAAWKAIVGYGEKARPALEAALKSENASVRFRSEQLIARLNGGAQERPLDDGSPTPVRPTPGGPGGAGGVPFGPGRGFTAEDFERMMRESQERMKKLEEEMRSQFGGGGPAFGPHLFPAWPEWRGRSRNVFGRGSSDRRVQVDGGELRESREGARIQLTETAVNGVSMSTVYEGKSVDAVLEAYPALRSHTVVKALLEKRADENLARAEREKAATDQGAPNDVRSSNKTVIVTSKDGRTTVSITETGPDGKQVTKTFEGADMDSIKREHPEVAESLGGGIRIEIGPGGRFSLGGGVRPMEPLPEDEFGAEAAESRTGPFGLGLTSLDDERRQHLSLEKGTGAVVAAVRAGSDADKIGLKVEDVIVSINGTKVTGPDKVAESIRAAKDAALSIDVIRENKPLTLTR